MFAWRKKPEGFEWHQYIRTTIKVRRDARKQKVVDARRAAGEQMNAAGVALAAGSRAAGSAAVDGARAGAGALALGVQGVWAVAMHALGVLARAIVRIVARPHIGGPLGFAGAIAVGAAAGRARLVGLDGEALLTLIVGIVLMACLLPMLARSLNWRMPNVPGLSPRTAMVGAVLIALAGGAAWLASGGRVGALAGVANLPFIGGSPPLQGRAYAMGPDTLRVGSSTVTLMSIEAPEREQRCGNQRGRSWRCGSAAESGLSRIVDGRTVSCAVSGSDDAGRKTARCTVGSKDVGAELVRRGYVFADGTILARYGSEEREARNAKAGLWSGGNTERPAAYRAKVWDEAKKRAPDGCPIKGQIAGGSRIYVLPWSPDYDRVRVQRARGERWFCSEQEAVSAGFKAAQRG
jgi:endonuclease YncB( thermonuclease family)